MNINIHKPVLIGLRARTVALQLSKTDCHRCCPPGVEQPCAAVQSDPPRAASSRAAPAAPAAPAASSAGRWARFMGCWSPSSFFCPPRFIKTLVLVDCCTVYVEFIRHVSILSWWFLISKPIGETTRRRSGAGTIYITLYMIIRYTGNIFTYKCLERFAASQLHSSVEAWPATCRAQTRLFFVGPSVGSCFQPSGLKEWSTLGMASKHVKNPDELVLVEQVGTWTCCRRFTKVISTVKTYWKTDKKSSTRKEET